MTLFRTMGELRRSGTATAQSASWPKGYEGKRALLEGGSRVRALRYQRASQDQHGERYSVTSQGNLNREVAERYQWTDAGSFTDNNISASRNGRGKVRPEFELLLDAIEGGKGDVLVIVELPRAHRDLAVYVKIRDLSVKSGLRYWCIGGSVYDLRDRNDRMALGMQAVQAEGTSDAIKEGTLWGMLLQAQQGRPHGATLFGYIRSYKPASGKFAGQALDKGNHTDENGRTWTAAGIVQGIFTRYLAGEPPTAIARDLNRRGIPVPRLYAAQRIDHEERIVKWQGTRWRDVGVLHILKNVAYIGKRLHNKALAGDGQWPALVTQQQFFAVQAKIAGSTVRGERVTSVRWLLSCLAKCAECGDDMVRTPPARRQKPGLGSYRCKQSCAAVPVQDLEAYVCEWLLDQVGRPDLAEANDAVMEEAAAAHAAIEQAQADLAEAKAAFLDDARPWMDQEMFDNKAARLFKAITDAEQVLYAGLPTAVAALTGPGAQGRWEQMSLPQKRDVIRSVAGIRVKSVGRGRRNVAMAERVILRNLLVDTPTAQA